MDETESFQQPGAIGPLFERLKETAEVAGLTLVRGLPHRQPAWTWEGDEGDETAFIGIASRAGAHLIYFDVDAFRLTDEIRDRLLDANLIHDDNGDEPPLLQRVVERFATWQRFDGLSSGLTLVFVVDGLAHQLRRTEAWFDQLNDKLMQHIEELTATWSTQDEIEAQARGEARKQQADVLARSERYARARNDMQRTYVARDLFPDLDGEEIDQLVDLAGLIYWDDVEPEREQEQARYAADLLGRGLPVSQIAARLGVSTDRANRLLAIADAHQNAD